MEGQSNGHHEGATETIPTTRPPVGAHVLGTLQPASQRPAFGTPRLTSGNVRAPASIYDCEEGRRGEGGGVALTISGAAVLWLVGRLSRWWLLHLLHRRFLAYALRLDWKAEVWQCTWLESRWTVVPHLCDVEHDQHWTPTSSSPIESKPQVGPLPSEFYF